MQRRGVWWRGAVCSAAIAVAGCFAKSERKTHPEGEAGQPNESNAGTSSSGGSGGASPSAGSGGSMTASQGAAGGSGGSSAGSAGTDTSGGSAGTDASAGSTGTGSSAGSGGTGGLCSSVVACGGDVTGTWSVRSSCVDMKGQLDVTGLGLGCSSFSMSGSRVVTGIFTANADGTYVDRTTTWGEERLELPDACLSVGLALPCDRFDAVMAGYGYDSMTCVPNPESDGTACFCDGTFEQLAGMGALSYEPPDRGTYSYSGDVVTLHGENNTEPVDYLYCVSGDQLTLLPRTTATGTPRGAIVLARQ
jgi:hypothetical protein